MATRTSALVTIPAGRVRLEGNLVVPEGARGTVVFAHGSGSSRLSPRNTAVAETLNDAGFGTLLFDLLTPAEDATYANRFDIRLLADRLRAATGWLRGEETEQLPLGYFGASTGAAAALVAAAETGDEVAAVVSRGGRPDMAGYALEKVTAPTLLIVGGDDPQVIELNRQAYALLRTEKELRIVPDATHLFEEPGTLEEVASLATAWFERYLSGETGA